MGGFYLKVALGSLLLVIGLAWGVSWSKADERSAKTLGAEFHQAPNCTRSSNPASALEPCSYETVRVVDKKIYHDKHFDSYSIGLETAEGTLSRAGISETMYELISPGSDLTAKFWRGKLRSLIYRGVTSRTKDNPDVVSGGSEDSLFIVLYGAGVFALVLVAYWQAQWKLLHGGPVPAASTASEYPLVRDDG